MRCSGESRRFKRRSFWGTVGETTDNNGLKCFQVNFGVLQPAPDGREWRRVHNLVKLRHDRIESGTAYGG